MSRFVIVSLCLIGGFAMVFSINSGNNDDIRIRRAAVAGSFYPDDPVKLRNMIETFLSQTKRTNLPGPVMGLVSPHAGYIYSGHVAANGYKLLSNRDINRVIVISPSHVASFAGAAVYDGDAYETPLGQVLIDKNFSKKLAQENSLIKLSSEGHETIRQGRMEHALEVQLPFLQCTLDNFQLVAIIMGDQSYSTCRALGMEIAENIHDEHTIIIASSDLSHFHEYTDASKRDKSLIHAIDEWDYFNLSRNLKSRLWEACGGGPIVATMIACENLQAGNSRVLKYANSGDVAAGNKSQVVGYASIAFYQDKSSKINNTKEFRLSTDEQKYLLNIAKQTVRTAVEDGQVFDCTSGGYDALAIERGAFVTLNKSENLRGCIGYTSPIKPLCETVRDVAISAALKDPRFPAVTPAELDELSYEISVLSPFRKVMDLNQIQIGTHGLLIKYGRSEGLLLPQVATDHNWDRETFLANTCRKAGLPMDTWKNPEADIFMFSAFVFGDKH
jgi:MEMO1 family protein